MGRNMHDRAETSPPESLVRGWERQGVISVGARWLRQSGGHSNPVWRIMDRDQDLICKLYRLENRSPLFGNDPDLEALSLAALAGSRISPRLVARLSVGGKQSLIYSYLPGPQWSGDVADVARLLARLHSKPAPVGLPSASSTPDILVAQTLKMQPDMSVPLPTSPLPPAPQAVFLHGDVVPGNLVQTETGLRLIDWQCPAVGDPTLDLAIFLSPAMQVIYGHRPLTISEINTFFQSYGRADVERRYRALAPLFHARMAAYCLWKGALGSAAHASAAALELQMLNQS